MLSKGRYIYLRLAWCIDAWCRAWLHSLTALGCRVWSRLPNRTSLDTRPRRCRLQVVNANACPSVGDIHGESIYGGRLGCGRCGLISTSAEVVDSGCIDESPYWFVVYLNLNSRKLSSCYRIFVIIYSWFTYRWIIYSWLRRTVFSILFVLILALKYSCKAHGGHEARNWVTYILKWTTIASQSNTSKIVACTLFPPNTTCTLK